jgi:hypothetical protein
MSENMTHNVGDKLTIRRGKLKGQTGEVALVGKGEDGTAVYVLQLPNGVLASEGHSNVKAEPEATIGTAQLADVLSDWLLDVPDRGVANPLIGALTQLLPGLANKIKHERI